MDDEFFTKLRATQSFTDFVKTNAKHISEEEYYNLLGKCCDETGVGYPDNWSTMGVYSKMGWSNKRKAIFYELFLTTGTKVKWKGEFEERLKEYLNQQADKPQTPLAELEWYSLKRKELTDILAQEDDKIINEPTNIADDRTGSHNLED